MTYDAKPHLIEVFSRMIPHRFASRNLVRVPTVSVATRRSETVETVKDCASATGN